MESNQRMFKNPILEILTQSGPKMMVTFHVLLSTVLVLVGANNTDTSLVLALLLFFSGAIIWTLFEYILHKYLFHIEGKSKFSKNFHYTLHGYHHDHPNDSKRLFMPPLPATIILLIFFGLFYLFLGMNAFFFLAGFEIGYLMYAYMHYAIHMNHKNGYVQKMKHHHNMHHYKSEDTAFGVSNVFWDKLFGTMPSQSIGK